MKLLVASTVVLTSACSGAGFPSLLGGDSAGNGNIVVRSGSYEDAKGANTGTFVGQKIIAFRQELEQIKVSHQSNREELTRIQRTLPPIRLSITIPSAQSKANCKSAPRPATPICTTCCSRRKTTCRRCQ